MAAIKLVVGSVVRLKSGGPWMTVDKDRAERGSKFVGVVFFDGSSLTRDELPKDVLEPDEATIKAAEAAEKAKAKSAETAGE